MKICFITFEYPPLKIGGAGIYALHITRELAKLGHEIHVISRSVNVSEMHSLENDVFVHRIPTIHKPFLNAPLFWFSLVKRYSKIRENVGGFDILHENDTGGFSLSKWQANEPRVVTIHHLAYLLAQRTPLLKRLFNISCEVGFTPFIQRTIISRADKIIAVSNFTKRCLISIYNVPSSKIEVIPHGISIDTHLSSKNDIIEFRKLIGLDDYFTFLFVGRKDDPRKNLSLLLKAFKILRKETRKPVKLVLVGTGNRLKIKEHAYSLGIEKDIVILGYVDRNTLKKCYEACDALVHPSMLEGFGLTILEAMATAKPIIALNRGAIPEIVEDGVNGFLVDKEDPHELADNMGFLVNNPDTAKSIGRKNRECVLKNFSWEKSAKITERVYNTLLCSAEGICKR